MSFKNETLYKCNACEEVGLHNYEAKRIEEFNENEWAEFLKSLTCEKCGSEEKILGWIDTAGESHTEKWVKFLEI